MSDSTIGSTPIIFTKPEYLFRLCTSFAPGDLIVAIRPDGSVEFGPGYTTLDEASRRFWEHMGRLPQKLAETEKERDGAQVSQLALLHIVRDLEQQLRTVAERQREACALRADFGYSTPDEIRATPLVTEEDQ